MRVARVMRRRRLLRAAAVGGLAHRTGKRMGQDDRDEEARPAKTDEAGAPRAGSEQRKRAVDG